MDLRYPHHNVDELTLIPNAKMQGNPASGCIILLSYLNPVINKHLFIYIFATVPCVYVVLCRANDKLNQQQQQQAIELMLD